MSVGARRLGQQHGDGSGAPAPGPESPLPAPGADCVTHHDACACRMLSIAKGIDALKAERDALRAQINAMSEEPGSGRSLWEQNAALRAENARLKDALASHGKGCWL